MTQRCVVINPSFVPSALSCLFDMVSKTILFMSTPTTGVGVRVRCSNLILPQHNKDNLVAEVAT